MTISKKGKKSVKLNWGMAHESFKGAAPAARLEILAQLCTNSSEDCLKKSMTFPMNSVEASFLIGMKTAFDTMSATLYDNKSEYLS